MNKDQTAYGLTDELEVLEWWISYRPCVGYAVPSEATVARFDKLAQGLATMRAGGIVDRGPLSTGSGASVLHGKQ